MSSSVPIVMLGAAGRMGRMILTLAAGQPGDFTIVGAVDRPDLPEQGRPLSEMIPGAPDKVALTTAPPEEVPEGTVVIDYSAPEATLAQLDWVAAHPAAMLIGTTGFEPEHEARIRELGARRPVMITPNTSTGVNVLFWLVEQATRLLGTEYDIEIVEMHHHHKKDAPSGTARRLAEVALGARGLDYEHDVRHGRQGQVGARTAAEVGMHALRGGDVVGEHTVTLAGPGERIELTHRAHSREIFARGALKAAAWLSRQPAGNYSMNDFLGL